MQRLDWRVGLEPNLRAVHDTRRCDTGNADPVPLVPAVQLLLLLSAITRWCEDSLLLMVC